MKDDVLNSPLTQTYLHIAELWTAQRWEEWERLTATEYSFDPGLGPLRDLAGTLNWSRAIHAAFPDYSQVTEHVVESGDTVMGVAVMQGTHTGVLDLGVGPPIQPSGRKVAAPYFKILTFDASGLVVRDKQFLDARRLLGGGS